METGLSAGGGSALSQRLAAGRPTDFGSESVAAPVVAALLHAFAAWLQGLAEEGGTPAAGVSRAKPLLFSEPAAVEWLRRTYGATPETAQRLLQRLRRDGVVRPDPARPAHTGAGQSPSSRSPGQKAGDAAQGWSFDPFLANWLQPPPAALGATPDAPAQQSGRAGADPEAVLSQCVFLFEEPPGNLTEDELHNFDAIEEGLHFFYPAGLSRAEQVQLCSGVQTLIPAVRLLAPQEPPQGQPGHPADAVMRLGDSILAVAPVAAPCGERFSAGQRRPGGALHLAVGSCAKGGELRAHGRLRVTCELLRSFGGPLEQLRARYSLQELRPQLQQLCERLVSATAVEQMTGGGGVARTPGTVAFYPFSTPSSALRGGGRCWQSTSGVLAAAHRAADTVLSDPLQLGSCALLAESVAWQEMPQALLLPAVLAAAPGRLRELTRRHERLLLCRRKEQRAAVAAAHGAGPAAEPVSGAVLKATLNTSMGSGYSLSACYGADTAAPLLLEVTPIWVSEAQYEELLSGRPAVGEGSRRGDAPGAPGNIGRTQSALGGVCRAETHPGPSGADRPLQRSHTDPVSMQQRVTGPDAWGPHAALQQPWVPAYLTASPEPSDMGSPQQSQDARGRWLGMLLAARRSAAVVVLAPFSHALARVSDSQFREAAARALSELDDAATRAAAVSRDSVSPTRPAAGTAAKEPPAPQLFQQEATVSLRDSRSECGWRQLLWGRRDSLAELTGRSGPGALRDRRPQRHPATAAAAAFDCD
eukprot:TRINITY_DN34598_c0_g1_i1.p1 TRINITY_DN34598_c0_g1~~TRINITY_DN34598_c0_g1_i1.p1  ORF type:complete len:786 (+),score=175.46 TRINITY_DN34598_c0_g1_i1:81-2360(+)